MNTYFSVLKSPVGDLLLTTDGEGLTGLTMDPDTGRRRIAGDWKRDDRALRAVRTQLDAYFASELFAFDLPLRAHGTAFQERVWKALVRVPFATTASYGAIAARVGSPGASRAVGMANHRNPIGIIVPCHHIVGADGSLTGYGGGLGRKKWLLDHEARARR